MAGKRFQQFTTGKEQTHFIRRCCLLLVYCFFTATAVAQETETMVNQLRQSTSDTAKAGLYTRISNNYFFNDPALALKYATDGIGFAKTKELDNYLPALYFAAGNAYNSLGNDDSSLISFNQCNSMAQKTGKPDLQVNSQRMAGYILINQSKFDEATDKLFNALKIAEAARDEALIAPVNSTISNLYLYQSNYDKALAYGEKALEYFKHAGNVQRLASTYLNVGLIYAEINNTTKASDYYHHSLEEYNKINYRVGMATVYGNMSNLETDDRLKKIDYLLKAKEIWDSVSPQHPSAVGNTGNLGQAYRSIAVDSIYNKLRSAGKLTFTQQQLLQKAEEYLSYAVNMCRKLDFGRDLAYFLSELAGLEEQKGDAIMANKYLHEYIVLNDSLYSQDNKNKIAEAEGKYVIDHKNSELAINKLTIANNQKVKIGLIAGLALLATIGILLYYQGRSSKRSNARLMELNNKLDEANKTKATFFAILSHDLRSPVANLVNFLQLQKRSPGLLNEQQVADREKKISATAETLLETMETMLLWSKGQMEKFVPQIKKIPVHHLFDYLQKFFSGTEKVQVVFSDPKGLLLTSDENYLQTIMQNLTSNAIHALANTPSPRVEWIAFEENGKTVLSLTDNGPGMHSDLLKEEGLFHPNNRTGLGMHIVRDLAAAINCRITAENLAGGGLQFYLYP